MRLAPNPKPWRVLLAAALATLVIFGALVGGITLRLRGELRAQVLRREAEAIHAVALMQLGAAGAAQDLFLAVLESSRLRGVLAVELFDAEGALRAAVPETGESRALIAPWWPPGARDGPVARFNARGSLESVYGFTVEPDGGPTTAPLLEVAVPLRAGPQAGSPMGVAHYWIDGAPVAGEFGRMDRGLAWQAGLALAGGAAAVLLVLAWALRRIEQAHRRLREQSADLARANRELDFAAKTGALGAISAHLIHGLSNPLAGLEGFVAGQASGGNETANGEAWSAAVETTRRLRTMVNEVVAVLRDEAGGAADYRVPAAEVAAAARAQVAARAEAAGVELVVTAPPDIELGARQARLAGLVLANLLANAIEASPRGAGVTLEARAAEGGVEFLTGDAGGGLPAEVRAALFQPLVSAKPGGGGVGLAISQRLARHALGRLELVRSDARGTVFRLWVPAT